MSILYCHIDNEFICSTTDYHQVGLKPDLGFHTITVVDKNGSSIAKRFEVVSK